MPAAEPAARPRKGRLHTRTRVALAFALLALGVLAAVALMAGQAAARLAERDAQRLLQLLAADTAARLQADVQARMDEIARLAATESTLGLQLTPAHWQAAFERLQRELPHYAWIGLTDAQGTVLAATRGLLVGQRMDQRPWFAAAQQQQALLDLHAAKALADELPPRVDGEPHRFVDIAVPLRRGDRTVGVLAAHLSWAWAEQRRAAALAAFEPGWQIDLQLLDRQGRVLPAATQPADALPGDADSLRATAVAPPLAEGVSALGWTVLARQPRAVALVGAADLQQRIRVVAALAALAFGLLGWWLAGRLTAPLRDLATQARRGSAAAPGPVAAAVIGDEVQQLAATLAHLIAGLESREAALQTANARLGSDVAARTRELQLANDDLRHVAQWIAHDLRAPLGQMALLLGRLLQAPAEALPDAARLRVAAVRDECERLQRLAEGLLSLATVQGRTVQAATVDLAAELAQAWGQLDAAAVAAAAGPGEGAAADGVPPPPAPQLLASPGPWPAVAGDPVLLRQVLVNLLSNARKFAAASRPPQVRVTARAEGGELRISVADNGVGFDPQQAKRLFQPFQRLHDARSFPGTGVGLALARRIVERHGGRVWAEAVPGEGACFHLSLPLAAAAPDGRGAPPPVSHTAAAAHADADTAEATAAG